MKSNLTELASQAHAYRQSAPSAQSLRYPDTFKLDVVYLLVGGTSLAKAHRALKIPISTLHSWKRRKSKTSKPAGSQLAPVFAELIRPPAEKRQAASSHLKITMSCALGSRIECELETNERAGEMMGDLLCRLMAESKR